MTSCCENKACELTELRERQRSVLVIVLLINALMFVAEAAAGLYASSTSLLADSLDMLGDALVYGFSLYVLDRSARWQAGAALAKGVVMAGFGLAVLAEAAWKVLTPVEPQAEVMGIFGMLALTANSICFALLWRHRGDNLNLRSTWLCSRNDLFANGGVIIAAAATAVLQSRWPDIAVGTAIALLFLSSAAGVLKEAVAGVRT